MSFQYFTNNGKDINERNLALKINREMLINATDAKSAMCSIPCTLMIPIIHCSLCVKLFQLEVFLCLVCWYFYKLKVNVSSDKLMYILNAKHEICMYYVHSNVNFTCFSIIRFKTIIIGWNSNMYASARSNGKEHINSS